MTVQSGLVPLLDEQTGRFPDEFAPPSVAADATAAHDAAEAAGRAQEAAEAAENNAAEHEREAGQIVEDATATIPGLIGEQVTAQIDPKVAAATQAKTDAQTAQGAAQTARDDALQAKAQAVAAQEAAAGSAGAAATSANDASAAAERAEVAAGQATAPTDEMVAGLIETPASETAAALSSTIGGFVAPALTAPAPVQVRKIGYGVMSVTNNGSAWAQHVDVDSTGSGKCDLVIPAQPGDIVTVGLQIDITTASGVGARLYWRVVSGSPRQWCASADLNTSTGIPTFPGGTRSQITAHNTDRVIASDLSYGYLVLRLRQVNTSGYGGTHTINTNPTTGSPFVVTALNTRSDRVRVLSPGLGWENGTVQEPTVWVEDDGTWWMLYTSGTPGRTNYATARGPYGPWTKRPTALMGSVHNSILIEDGVKYVYGGDPGNGLEVRYGTDLENLTLHPQKVIPSGSGTDFYQHTNTVIIKVDSTYHMLFETKQQSGGGAGPWLLGHATATSPLGPFTNVTYPLPSLERASNAAYSGPCLYHRNGKFVLYYHASCTANQNFPTDIYRAESVDCINWTLTPNFPIIEHQGAFGTLVEDQAADPWMVEDPATGIVYGFWTGQNNPTQVGGIYCSVPSRMPLSLDPTT